MDKKSFLTVSEMLEDLKSEETQKILQKIASMPISDIKGFDLPPKKSSIFKRIFEFLKKAL